ncbi:MAG: hypothetical protein Q8Q09_25200 [Deltaproteobacteria bacterium]|nr:hypothetical protein [Deltaproteobacteria bacterium]
MAALAWTSACGPTARPDADASDAQSDASLRADVPSDEPDADASAATASVGLACNPLGFSPTCAFPFPSTYYLAEDRATATGVRVAIPEGALPASLATSGSEGITFDPRELNRRDGFSPAGPFVLWFPERIDPATLVAASALDRSVLPQATTALVDMTTGERVPHFAEIDTLASARQRQTLVIRPMRRLAPGRRYAVAISRGVRAVGGGFLSVPPGFRAILDGSSASDPRLSRIASGYPAIFAALQRAGITRAELTLAFDVVTASERYLTDDVVRMRQQALDRVGPEGMGFSVTSIDEDFSSQILRRIRGTVRVPLFLTNGGGAGARLTRDADDHPVSSAFADVPFVAMIPRSAATASGPLPLVLFGHGLFGAAEEAMGGPEGTAYIQRIANEQGYVLVATNWTGLSMADISLALDALSDLNRLPLVTERLQQALINAMVLFRTARGQFGRDRAFQVQNRSSIDPARAYYYGISLGGIMGTSFLAHDPDCERGVVNVAGSTWSLLFQRNHGWTSFRVPIAMGYPTPDAQQLMLAIAQSFFDTTDPIHAAAHMFVDRLPGVPERKILYQITLGDSQVTNLGAFAAARTMALPLLTPSPAAPYGIEPRMGPLDSALAIWDEHPMSPPGDTNETPRPNMTHDTLRDRPTVREQIRRFLRPDGRVEHTCDGPCDPN